MSGESPDRPSPVATLPNPARVLQVAGRLLWCFALGASQLLVVLLLGELDPWLHSGRRLLSGVDGPWVVSVLGGGAVLGVLEGGMQRSTRSTFEVALFAGLCGLILAALGFAAGLIAELGWRLSIDQSVLTAAMHAFYYALGGGLIGCATGLVPASSAAMPERT